MKIHHVALRTPAPAALAAFYRTILGLEIVREQPHGIWLGLDDAVLMIEQAGPGEPPPDPGSLRLLAFAVDAEERAAIGARLAAAGLAIEARTAFTWYFRDPEGRRLGISTYPLEGGDQ